MSGRTLVFVVGVQTRLDPAIPEATFAESDALAFADAWRSVGTSAEDVVVLAGVEATFATVRSGLKRHAKNATPADRIVCFYSGHGVSVDGAAYLTLHDTQSDDLEATGLSLSTLLATLAAAKAGQTILFLDIARGGFSADGAALDLDGDRLAEELRDFCDDGASRVAFVSCGPGERSHASRTLGHGLWTHAVMQAVRGEPAALSQKRFLTVASLQSWLSDVVPRVLRETIAGAVVQTPALFGDRNDAIVLVDVDDLPGRPAGRTNGPAMLPSALLAGSTGGRVRELSGYRKPKLPLGSHSRWEREFIQAAGVREVSEQAEALFEEIRSSFDFKRRDVVFACDGPAASIRTPAFDADLSLDQDPEDATRYVLATQVSAFRRPEIVADPEFLRIFDQRCDRVVIEFDAPLDIEARIDEIESVDALADLLEYDRDATYLTLRMPGLNVRMHATGSRIAFFSDSRRDLRTLIENASKAVDYLAGSGAMARLPGS